jgi:phosphate transport system ATP-binding protein
MEAVAAARLEQVSVRFGERTAIDRVDLSIPAGRVTVLLGPSGSGKTTLLRTLNRLNEMFAGHRQDGRVLLHLDGREHDIGGPDIDVAWLRRRVAMVFQSPNVLPVSIEKNLALPLDLTLGVRGKPARERIERALDQAMLLDEVKDRMRDRATTLSGGQQQRLCLARALTLDPAVLLLDEPTASLDHRASRRIEALIERLKSRYTIVAVSHGLGQATRIADRAVVLRDGRVVEEMEQEALADPALFKRLVEEAF